jgi:Protein of unknown function (DUF2786)
MTSDNKLLERVRKLLAKAEDAGVIRAEAEALTGKAAELMARYGIDRALLAAARPETDHPADRVIDIRNPWARVQAHLLCGLGAAMRCQCILLTGSSTPSTRIHIFGFLCTLSSRTTVEPYLGRHWRHSDCRHGRWRRGRHAERKYPPLCVPSRPVSRVTGTLHVDRRRTSRCFIVQTPTPPSGETLLARTHRRATRAAHS